MKTMNPKNIIEIKDSAYMAFQKKDYSKAEKIYLDVLRIDSSCFVTFFNLGLIKLYFNDNKAAFIYFIKALKLNSNNSKLYINLAIINNRLERVDEAIEFLKKSLDIDFNLKVLLNLSSLYLSLKKPLMAINTLKNHIDYDNTGEIQTELSKISYNNNSFLSCIKFAVEVILLNRRDESFLISKNLFCDALRQIDDDEFLDDDLGVLKALNILLDEKNDIQTLRKGFTKFIFKNSRVNHSKVKNPIWTESFISNSINEDFSIFNDKAFLKCLTSELLIKYLKYNLVVSKYLENIYLNSRKFFLHEITNNKVKNIDNYIEFIASLSIQNEYNGYIWKVTDEELEELNKIEQEILSLINKNQIPDDSILAIYGCYYSLSSNKYILKFLSKNKKKYSNFIQEIIRTQITEPLEISENRDLIISPLKIDNKISLGVQKLYENYPYPRWKGGINILNNNNIRYYYSDKNLNRKIDQSVEMDILVAGCGTGKELLFLANFYKYSKITAIDISRSSLSYTNKKIKEYKITNVELLHLDILNVHSLEKKFDFITSNGVLHHMDNPSEGLNSLVSVLKNDGILNLGLYSKIARKKITMARDFIRNLGITGSKNEIIQIRESIINNELGFENFHELTLFRDFYSQYELQDLLFHPQEVLHTLKDIKNLLKSNNLKFINFDNKYNAAKEKYKKLYPSDKDLSSLDNWAEFEENNPETFRGMYLFYADKL